MLFNAFLLVLIACSTHAGVTPEVAQFYRNIATEKGLYTESDKITILNATNFNDEVYGANNLWLVEFYNSWCGYCHKFSPVWKSLAADIYGWRKVIKLGAIACSNDNNSDICTKHDVLAYPTFKFFPAKTNAGSKGFAAFKGLASQTQITRSIVNYLQVEQIEGRGATWPNISSYLGKNKNDLLNESNSSYVFLIFVNDTNLMDSQVILDFSTMNDITIRSISKNNTAFLEDFTVNYYPSLFVIERSQPVPVQLHPNESTRKSFRTTIKSYLTAKGLNVPEEPNFNKTSSRIPSTKELHDAEKWMTQLYEIKDLGDVVFLSDLEKTLRYSLGHEVLTKINITGEAFEALKNYISVVIKYFPVHESDRLFFKELYNSLLPENFISSVEFKALLFNNTNSTGTLDEVIPATKNWMGCMGSDINQRGYPCGLWMLFHYMTINSRNNATNSSEVLSAMLGYITHFFGCSDCSKHFQEMAQRSMKKNSSFEEAALWLWSAHNQVNQRLSKEGEEDPEFPKIQFPSIQNCPKCKNSLNEWNETHVLNYLTNMYDRENLKYLGSNSKLSQLSDTVGSEYFHNIASLGKSIPTLAFYIFVSCICKVLF